MKLKFLLHLSCKTAPRLQHRQLYTAFVYKTNAKVDPLEGCVAIGSIYNTHLLTNTNHACSLCVKRILSNTCDA